MVYSWHKQGGYQYDYMNIWKVEYGTENANANSVPVYLVYRFSRLLSKSDIRLLEKFNE